MFESTCELAPPSLLLPSCSSSSFTSTSICERLDSSSQDLICAFSRAAFGLDPLIRKKSPRQRERERGKLTAARNISFIYDIPLRSHRPRLIETQQNWGLPSTVGRNQRAEGATNGAEANFDCEATVNSSLKLISFATGDTHGKVLCALIALRT